MVNPTNPDTPTPAASAGPDTSAKHALGTAMNRVPVAGPDGCFTLPDGSCSAVGPCIHSPDFEAAERDARFMCGEGDCGISMPQASNLARAYLALGKRHQACGDALGLAMHEASTLRKELESLRSLPREGEAPVAYSDDLVVEVWRRAAKRFAKGTVSYSSYAWARAIIEEARAALASPLPAGRGSEVSEEMTVEDAWAALDRAVSRDPRFAGHLMTKYTMGQCADALKAAVDSFDTAAPGRGSKGAV